MAKKNDALNRPDTVQTDGSAFIPTPLESIGLDQPLPYDLFIQVAERYVLFRTSGDLLTKQRAKSLKAKKVSTVYIPKTSWVNYLDGLTNLRLSDGTQDSTVSRLRYLLVGYQQCLEKARQYERKAIDQMEILAREVADYVHQHPKLAGTLLKRYDEPQLYYVNHSVNVSVYSLAVACKLGYERSDMRMLGFAALVHNVGNLFVPEEILYKPSSLTKEEWDIMQTHPHRGADYLEELKVDKTIVTTAKHHHERVDGEGYPLKLKGPDIHPFAKITTIADVFDALTCPGPYQKGMDAGQAVEKMRHMHGKFDPEVLKMMTQ